MYYLKVLENQHRLLTLDHRIVPEVRAMLAAMVSRMPAGGIARRYEELVRAVGGDEEVLTRYPLHERVRGFFDEHVGRYGHSSPMELCGSPVVFTEGISWAACWLLFDSPLCAGQEFSTRALRHKDWPMASDARDDGNGYTDAAVRLHQDWLEVYEAEVEWWKGHLSDAGNRAALGIRDDEPFRPALDRARWALPGTIATGCVHTTGVRERARTLRDTSPIACGHAAGRSLWEEIVAAYADTIPGMAHLGMNEATTSSGDGPPDHLSSFLGTIPWDEGQDYDWFDDVRVEGLDLIGDLPGRKRPRSYCDPGMNRARVQLIFPSSLASARDWHRHRTAYPWSAGLFRDRAGLVRLSEYYEPKSKFGISRVHGLLERSTRMFDAEYAASPMLAATRLPLGARVLLSAWAGLRDAIYMLELRRDARGANFEYRDHASRALSRVATDLGPYYSKKVWPTPATTGGE